MIGKVILALVVFLLLLYLLEVVHP